MAKTAKASSKVNVAQGKIPENNSPFTSDADSSVSELFVSEIKDTYWAENHLVKSLPKMIDAAWSKELKTALTDHLEVTKTHVTRLEQVFELLGENVLAKKCDAMEGLVMSGEHTIESTVAATLTRDTGIISSGLKVENFEITTYKGLINLANALGKTKVASLLQLNMNEEEEASNLLSSLSEKNLIK
jgi:ferritin-like metal-binding protein YciE